jgi:hypothetical protein
MKKLFKKLLCSHNYIKVDQFRLASEFDIVVKHGFKPTHWCSRKRKVVSIYKCINCNKIKRHIITTAVL